MKSIEEFWEHLTLKGIPTLQGDTRALNVNLSKTLKIFAYLMAMSRWAFLISGFMLRLAKMSVKEAPTIARWNFCVLLVFFLVVSSS